MAEFDPATYLATEDAPPKEPDLPEYKPNLTTFYYPATPEDTRKAGLSYSMEGGTQGGGKFGDVHLPNHTFEKFKEGKSEFVAVAMSGKPTGELFRTIVDGTPIIAKWVDTGGGLRPGQFDIATSNPDLARGGIEHGGGSGIPMADAGLPQRTRAAIPPIELDKKEEPKEKKRGGRISFAPEPTPKITLNLPQAAPTILPEPGTPQTNIGEAIKSPEGFSQAVQAATLNPPQSDLIVAGPGFDPSAYLAKASAGINTTPTVTPTPSAAPSAPSTQDFDPAAYLGARTSSQEIPQTLPTPSGKPEKPSPIQKSARAILKYGKDMIPHSAREVAGAAGVPTSLDPESITNAMLPMARPLTSAFHQIATRSKQVSDADKTPAGSQERYDAGFATVLDILQAAGAAKGGQVLARKSFAKPRMPEITESGVRGSGAFRRSYRLDKEIGQQMDMIGSAREFGMYKSIIKFRNLTLELSKDQIRELGQYLVSRRLKTVNPNHPQILPDADMTRIEKDPAIAKALDYWKNEVKPDIEQWRKRAGLTEEGAAGKEAEFISLVPTIDEPLAPKPGSGPASARRLPRTTSFAKPAEGFAKEYNTNIQQVLDRSYTEVIRKARTRELYAMAKDKDLASTSRIHTPEGWRTVTQYEDLHPDLQRDLTEATVRPPAPVGAEKVGPLIQRTITGAALTANPAELANHMRRQLGIVAAKPPVGLGVVARLEALAPYFGPKIGTLKRAIMTDFKLPENQQILGDIIESGGGSTRSFGEMYQSKIPGLKWLQHKTTNLLFGIPKGKGLNGYDLRMRVLLEKIRRSEEGIDPQRTREFSNGIGEYGSHTSWIVKGLRKFNPYAATTVPLRVSEMKQMVGVSGLKSEGIGMKSLRAGETFLRGTGGTLAMLTLANHQLSGKWPWQNDPGHEFDLNTGIKTKDGTTIYATLRSIDPNLFRALSTVSAPNLLRERTAKHPQYGVAAATGPTNQAASLISGPAQNFALTAATGKVPYFLKRPDEGPELMDLAMLKKGEAAKGVSRFQRQIFAAIGNVNPALARIFGSQFHVEVPDNLGYMQEPIYGVKPFGDVFSTSYEKKKSKGGGTPVYMGR